MKIYYYRKPQRDTSKPVAYVTKQTVDSSQVMVYNPPSIEKVFQGLVISIKIHEVEGSVVKILNTTLNYNKTLKEQILNNKVFFVTKAIQAVYLVISMTTVVAYI